MLWVDVPCAHRDFGFSPRYLLTNLANILKNEAQILLQFLFNDCWILLFTSNFLPQAYGNYMQFYSPPHLHHLGEQFPRFLAFMRQVERRRESGRQSLAALLVRPVQRLPSVALLMEGKSIYRLHFLLGRKYICHDIGIYLRVLAFSSAKEQIDCLAQIWRQNLCRGYICSLSCFWRGILCSIRNNGNREGSGHRLFLDICVSGPSSHLIEMFAWVF